MAGTDWSEAVEIAIRRLVARNGSDLFSRQQMIEHELDRIVRETGSRGTTPEMTLSRELQQLRDSGEIEFVARGQYRLLEPPFTLPHQPPSSCIFVIGAEVIYAEEPDSYVRFSSQFLEVAAATVGQWVVYQEPQASVRRRGYYAIARIEQIVRDPKDKTMFLALIEPGSFLEFGQDTATLSWPDAPKAASSTATFPKNDAKSVQSMHLITEIDFKRILELGLISENDILPREDSITPNDMNLKEDRAIFLDTIERSTSLVARKVRNQQFRKRVLDVYNCQCALTGLRLINGGGRAETQAAHIRSVESGGPDVVVNGIALSGTVHWMFDRGLISLSDSGEILLSAEINDTASVDKLILPDRLAKLPASEALRPNPRYLAWHREYHGFPR